MLFTIKIALLIETLIDTISIYFHATSASINHLIMVLSRPCKMVENEVQIKNNLCSIFAQELGREPQRKITKDSIRARRTAKFASIEDNL